MAQRGNDAPFPSTSPPNNTREAFPPTNTRAISVESNKQSDSVINVSAQENRHKRPVNASSQSVTTSDRHGCTISRTSTPITYSLPPFTGIGTAQFHRRRSKHWCFPLRGSRRRQRCNGRHATYTTAATSHTGKTASTAEEQCKDMTVVVAEQQTPEIRITTASKSQSTTTQQHWEEKELIETSGPDHQHHPEEEEEPASDDIYVDVLECPPCQPTPTADRT